MELDDPTGAADGPWFYVYQDDTTHGPFTLGQLQQRVVEGDLTAEALVCEAGEDKWSSIRAHEVLRPALADSFEIIHRLAKLRATLEEVGSHIFRQRDEAAALLSGIKVFYRTSTESFNSPIDEPVFFKTSDEKLGPTSLWIVFDLIDAGTLPVYTQVCTKGGDFWRGALTSCAKALGLRG